MTRIDFYVGQTSSLQARLRLACKLVEKAYKRQLAVYIHTDSAATSGQLDDLLWTFDPLAFIPHDLATPKVKNSPVRIGHDFEPTERCDVLINLSNQIPEFFARFERLAEILDQEQPVIHAGRKRYQFYRDRGYNLEYHQLQI